MGGYTGAPVIEPPAPCGLLTVSLCPCFKTAGLTSTGPWWVCKLHHSLLPCQTARSTCTGGPSHVHAWGLHNSPPLSTSAAALVLLDEPRVSSPVAASSFATQPGSSTASPSSVAAPSWLVLQTNQLLPELRRIGWSPRPTNELWVRAKLLGQADQPKARFLRGTPKGATSPPALRLVSGTRGEGPCDLLDPPPLTQQLLLVAPSICSL